ncbi:amino acid adenylation domain-containing protein, partial [Rhodococcus sp. A14]|uniref:amino acid adenylation domain-containing protein n=1 Tax=Rhodococcus sp. A14 TaxID=1194106 RepID=UPI0032165BB7
MRPKTVTEEILLGIFRDVLGLPELSVDTSFFELGGNSLMATQVVSRVNAALSVRIGVRDLFQSPSVSQLAVAAANTSPQPDPRPVLEARQRPDRVPLSVAQQRMWFLNQFDTASPAYNLPIALRLTGPLDRNALRAALDDVQERHEALRTVFPDTPDGPHQLIMPAVSVLAGDDPIDVDADSLTAAVTALGGAGFDLTIDRPLRAGLFREAPHRHVLVLVVHHIAADGWSMTPLAADVMVAYAARAAGHAPTWAPLPVQYADYSLWQRDLLGSEDDPNSLSARQIAHWQAALTGVPPLIELPTDRTRPAEMSHRGGRVEFTIPADVHGRLVDLAQSTGTTPFMVTHAALAVLLRRLGAGSDIVIGTPVAGRGEEALDHLVGMFVNTLVLRTTVDPGDTFGDVLARTRDADLAAFQHGDVPFERLVEVLSPARSSAHHPLFQVMLTFQNTANTRVELDGLEVDAAEIDVHVAKFDLQLTVVEQFDSAGVPAGLAVQLSYATDLFDEDTAVSIGERFGRLLDAVVDNPPVSVGDIDLLDADERSALAAANATHHPVPADTLVSLFAAQAAATPDAVALVFEDRWLTYAEFDKHTDRLARYLIGIGVGPESVVAVGIRRSLDLLVAIYAIVKAGAAYLPIDPDHPAERTAYVLDTAQPVCVLTRADDTTFSTAAPVVNVDTLDLPDEDSAPISTTLTADNTAYVIFTSGSTGRPKGVAVTHGAIVNRLQWMQHEYRLTSDDAVMQKTPVTFDVSVWELFWPLQVGATLVIAAPDGHRDPDYLATLIRRHRITTMHFVPSMLSVFTAEPAAAQCDSLRLVFCSGEALTPEQVSRFRSVSRADLHNLYGPTEAAVDVTYWETGAADTVTVPIGRPVWNTQLHVLDARLHPVPNGVAGELYLAGDQLARGYLNRPDLSADRFVANPHVAGGRMYRTGDLVRRRRDGALEYVGRTDFQVKLRGQRIELGEIETALETHPDVSQAVVVVHRDDRGEEALVAYTVGAVDVAATDLRDHLARVLPSYMIPVHVVHLDTLPLSVNGKLDRKALPAPNLDAATTDYVAPRTPAEMIVAGVFTEILGVERAGVHDHFFDLGGNSLVATRLVSRLRTALGVPVSLRDVFDAPTVGALAQRYEGVDRDTNPSSPALAPQLRPERVPLSPAQQRVWFLNQFDTSSPVYNLPLAVRFSGDLDVTALNRALRDVLNRHESLRTVFPGSDTGPWQRILDAHDVDLGLTVVEAREADLDNSIRTFALTGFDVSTEIPVRAQLLRVRDDEHVLTLVVHHIAADGWSFAPLSRDLMLAYAAHSGGHELQWTPLPVQYADYTLWQRELLGEEDDPNSRSARQLSYWGTALAGLPDSIDLPTDRPRPAVASKHGATLSWEVSAELHQRLLTLARTQNATLFMVAHSALSVLLSRLGATTDIAIGTPVAGRGERELDDLVGMFVNTLVLRAQVDPASSFTALLQQVRDVDLTAFAHVDVPFERLVEHLNPTRTAAHHPLFQVALFFQNHAPAHLELPGLSVSSEPVLPDVAAFDLQLVLTDTHGADGSPGPIAAEFNYATELFDESTIRSFGAQFVRILEAVTDAPQTPVGDIAIADPTARLRELAGWNATDHEVPVATLPDLFDAQVARTPGATALVFDSVSLTYAELDERANRLARYLVSCGVGPESRVALAMRRSLDLVVGMYAVVKAGGAYVPVDPDHPADRIGYVLQSAGPIRVLTTTVDQPAPRSGVDVVTIDDLDLTDFSGACVTDADRAYPLRADNTAYVIYTSGSTGKPKGVAVPHAGIVNQLVWMQSEYPLTARDVVLQKTATTFDVSVWGFFWPLQVGAAMVLASPDGHRDPGYLAEVIDAQGVTVTDFVPSMLDVFVASVPSGSCSSLRHVFVIGEALSPETASRFRALSSAGLHNLYGPTEAAVSVTYWETSDADDTTVPIGVPEWNTHAYVLDSRLHPVPVGVPGELYLGGIQLARGYLGRVDLTSDRFVANPFGDTGARMYRTGDLVRRRRDGVLEYIGRTDFQVKFRGQRIELGEIEAVLRSHPEVTGAAVLVYSDAATGDHLVAYVVSAPGRAVDAADLRRHAAGALPAYMLPSVVVLLDEFPLNTSGKLDRTALPAPEFSSAAGEYIAPSTSVEHSVAAVFGTVLGLDRVSVHDSFFDLGGNSLIATQLVSRIRSELDVPLAVRDLFESPTVAELAARLSQSDSADTRPALTRRERPEQVPLSPAQQRMWFLNQFDPSSPAYNLPFAVRFTGALDRAALEAAIADLIERHETLRTVFPDSATGPHQVVRDTADAPVNLSVAAVGEDDLETVLGRFFTTGFDVTTDLPVRVTLIRVGANDHVLALVVHHISGDGWSMAPMVRDVMIAYAARTRGECPTWTALPVQYADYALWQRDLLGEESDPDSVAARQLDFWANTLAGVPEELDLPTDRPRPAEQSYRGRHVDFAVDASTHRALAALAQSRRATLFMAVHTALAVLLGRLSASSDVTIGTPVAGRGERELDDLIGMFVNTVTLRTPVDPGSAFTDLLDHVRDVDLAAFSHADVPFERLVEVLSPTRHAARHPLFQVMLTFQNLEQTTLELDGLTLRGLDTDIDVAKFDLHLTLVERFDADGDPDGITAQLTYASDLFDEATAAAIAARFTAILDAVTTDSGTRVGDIELLDAGESAALTHWNSTNHDVPVATLPDLFDTQVARTPGATAVVFEDAALTYAEFDARVNRLARYLVACGVGPESRVVLAMRRSLDLVVGMYAVVKAGGAYVPVDPDHPVDRIGYVLDSAQPVCVLSTSADRGDLPAMFPVIEVDALDLSEFGSHPITDADRVAPLRPSNTAYVIYTSGSTGKPKGVAVPHAGIVNQLVWMQSEYPLTARDVVLQKTATTFDVSVWGFFWPLQVGAAMVLASPDGHRDPGYLAEVIDAQGVTVTDFVPSMLDVFVASVPSGSCSSLRHVFVIGEALSPETASRFRALSSAGLHNLYGPTEAAVSVTYWETSDADDTTVPIGVPEWNTHAYVLDSRLHPVPVGVPGELYLGGIQLARGYLGRVDLTSDRFVANPFGDTGARMYRTGDLVRRRRDGVLEYIGRTDFQVKFRGQRIELGEIEAVLRSHPEVTGAAVLVYSDAATGDHLVAYVVPASGRAVDAAALRAYASGALPSYMLPSVVVLLDEFPLNTSGKLDRTALPDPEFGSNATEYVAPRNEVEQRVADVFADVLDAGRIGVHDSFFDLGGNSLSVTRVTARITEATGTRLSVRDVFDAPTVAALALRIDSTTSAVRPGLTAVTRPARIPLSLAQQRMWFLNQFDADSPAYNLPFAVRLSGAIDTAALAVAFDDVVERHETLRTVFPDGGDGPEQIVLPASDVSVTLQPVDVTETDLLGRMLAFASRGFDVTAETPIRATLFRTSPTEHVLAISLHHIAADGWSFGPLGRDVMVAYAARADGHAPQWAPLEVQYADYSVWQREVLGSEDDAESVMSAQLGYWTHTLAGVPDALRLPFDRPRPAQPTYAGRSVGFGIDPETHCGIQRLAREHGATTFMVAHAAFALLLGRLSATDDVAIGTPIAGRGERALDDLVGMFVNTLVLRTAVRSEDSFAELLHTVRDTDLAAFAHADVPFERLVDVLAPTRTPAHHPIYQVALSMNPVQADEYELPGLRIGVEDVDPGVAKIDLQLTLGENLDDTGAPSGIRAEFTYATDLFDESTVRDLAWRLQRILEAVISDPGTAVGDLDLLHDTERAALVPATGRPGLAPVTVPDLLAGAVRSNPDGDALVAPTAVGVSAGETSTLTYRELDAESNRLARLLAAMQVGPEVSVALALPRSRESVAATWAVAKAGAAFVPVDPGYPFERIAFMLEDCGAPIGITTAALREGLPDATQWIVLDDAEFVSAVASYPADAVTDADRAGVLSVDHPAYVIYTSGSTGRPKGVAVTHRG